jgi:hypothetical protein
MHDAELMHPCLRSDLARATGSSRAAAERAISGPTRRDVGSFFRFLVAYGVLRGAVGKGLVVPGVRAECVREAVLCVALTKEVVAPKLTNGSM